MEMVSWQYDESKCCGLDFCDTQVAKEYEAAHSQFRNLDDAASRAFELLAVPSDAIVVDLGCGPGHFVVHAAQRCRKVIAVDISQAMLNLTGEKAKSLGLSNIEYVQDGLLGFKAESESIDAVASSLVMHHLPDYWKLISLKNIASMLKPGGKFYLLDTVFPSVVDDYDEYISGLLNESGEMLQNRLTRHIRNEFSTFDWVMHGLLQRVGFEVVSKNGNEMKWEYLSIKR